VNDLSARLQVLADDLTGPDPVVSAPDAIARYRHRRRARAGLIAVVAAVAVIAVGVPVVGNSLSSAPATPAAPAPHTTTPPPPQTPTSGLDPSDRPLETATSAASSAAVSAEELAALQAVAAQLTSPVSLTSPTEWDQWLPAGKPYPGASTEDDISTCPHLADGLTAALGQKMSYWIGTLPSGPVGCEWVPVPLKYGPDPYDYAYVLSVGFLGDGTAPDGVPSYEHQGQPCPTVPVPSVDPLAVLTRCDTGTGVDLQLTLPDARGAGTWVLDAQARSDGPHTADEALRALVHGVGLAYG
jgi:hypothetical protein